MEIVLAVVALLVGFVVLAVGFVFTVAAESSPTQHLIGTAAFATGGLVSIGGGIYLLFRKEKS